MDGEASSFAFPAFNLHPAAVPIHYLLHYGKTHAQTAAFAIAPGIGTPEPREHHFRLFGRKTDARVAHRYGSRRVVFRDAHRNAPTLRRVTHRVRNEVRRRLPNHVGVAQHTHPFFSNVFQGQTRIGHERLVRGDDARNKIAHIDELFFRRIGAILQTGKLQKRIHQPA